MLKRSLMPIIFSALAITRVVSAEEIPADSLVSLIPRPQQGKTPGPLASPPTRQQQAQRSAPPKKECLNYARTMRIAARHIEAGGIGYKKGYSSLDAFFAPSPSSSGWMPFLDLRGHIFNEGRLAANAGVGLRMTGGNRIYGINGYYDYRKTKHQHYNQFSLGLETLGDVWDFRMNGYLPFGDKKSSPHRLRFDHFSGNNIILSQRFEYAMKGADAELGFHFGRTVDWDCWVAAGPYYFIGELGGPRWGAKGRIGTSFRQYLTLEFLNSWDETFHYRPQGQITLSWPFGPKAKMKKHSPCSLSLRMVQPVNRQEVIVTDSASKHKIAIDPTTGLPFFVIFVDNTSSSNGTFQSPYPSLAQAESASSPGDIIYVFPGNGTTSNMNAGILLLPDQSFWGSGVSHNLITTLGTVTIPAQSATNPLITNTAGSAITLASGNDVSGFSITRPNLHGVTGSDVTDIALSNLWIFGAQSTMGGGNGINIIENNGLINNLALFNLFVTNNARNGIFIETDGTSSANVVIADSTVTLNGAGVATSSGVVLRATMASNMNASLQNNAILANSFNGLLLDSASTGALNYHLENNTIDEHSNFGFSGLFTGNSTVNMALLGNVITHSTNEGMNLSFIGPATLIAKNNHFDEIANTACHLTAGNSAFTALFENNSMSDNGARGLFFAQNGSQNITFMLHNNDISYNCENGATFESVAGMQLNLEMLNNTVNGNSIGGIVIGSSGAASISVVANDNVINGNGSSALTIGTITITTELNFTANNNTISGNCGDAIQILPTSISSCILTANNNLISGNGGAPIALSTKQANAIVSISNNIFDGNISIASIDSTPSGTNNLEIIWDNNQISTGDPISIDGIAFQYTGTNTGTNTFIATNNRITHSRNGISVNLVNGANGESMDVILSNNSTAYNTNNGINIFASPANSFTLNTQLANNTANNNDLNGINVVAQNSVILNINAVENTLFNNHPLGTSDMFINHNSAMGSICLDMRNNSSNVGYTLNNAAGTFNLAPNGVVGAQAVNVGTISTTGTITSVPSCP